MVCGVKDRRHVCVNSHNNRSISSRPKSASSENDCLYNINWLAALFRIPWCVSVKPQHEHSIALKSASSENDCLYNINWLDALFQSGLARQTIEVASEQEVEHPIFHTIYADNHGATINRAKPEIWPRPFATAKPPSPIISARSCRQPPACENRRCSASAWNVKRLIVIKFLFFRHMLTLVKMYFYK